ncbi:hypothetical protein [Uliginosibacterium sp. H1]|uniref:hypothetical protein n=1 Tax=Uliginosibacterium sp. H1 TaxID=3114757 RepID=UPI002E19C484|nr:hypothetical protein [Uliginosibacterium sp. H1]
MLKIIAIACKRKNETREQRAGMEIGRWRGGTTDGAFGWMAGSVARTRSRAASNHVNSAFTTPGRRFENAGPRWMITP